MRALVIDGDGGRLAPVRESLRSSDAPPFEVREAPLLESSSPPGAGRERPDVVVVDVGSADAAELTRLSQTLERFEDVPVVAVTEPGSVAAQLAARAAGAHAALPADAAADWIVSIVAQAVHAGAAGAGASPESERLRRERDSLSAFAHRVSHDLKGPARRLGSLAKWLEEDLGDGCDEETRELLEQIVQQTAEQQTLISKHMAFAEAGGDSLRFEPVSVSEVVLEALAPLGAGCEPAGPNVEALPFIEGDAFWLKQALSSLIETLVPEAGAPDPSNVRLSVEALGAGSTSELILIRRGPPPAGFDAADPCTPMCGCVLMRHGATAWAESAGPEGPTRIHVKFHRRRAA